MTETIRTFTKEGTQRFAEFIAELKFNPTLPVPFDLLTDDSFTIPLPVELTISNDPVSTKMDLALRLDQALGDFPQSGVGNDLLAGMWNWLGLFFFESIAPNKKTGSADRLILNYDWKRRTRHLLESSYMVYKTHGQISEIVLFNNPYTGGEVFDQLAGRREWWSNEGLLQFVHRLYWDDKAGSQKKGVTSETRQGSVRRLAKVLNQLQLTYDLYDLSIDQFVVLAPPEFDSWLKSDSSK